MRPPAYEVRLFAATSERACRCHSGLESASTTGDVALATAGTASAGDVGWSVHAAAMASRVAASAARALASELRTDMRRDGFEPVGRASGNARTGGTLGSLR